MAYFFTGPPEKPVTPLGLRAPELIVTGDANNTIDNWSFDCLVFELITGRPPFCVPPHEDADEEHLLSMNARLGALPDEFFEHWKASSEKISSTVTRWSRSGRELLLLKELSMEELLDQTSSHLDEHEACQVKTLILQYDPAARPSPVEIVADPWLCAIPDKDSSE